MTERNGHREMYLRTLERVLLRLHTPRFETLWTVPSREGEWCGRFQSTQNMAFQFALLFQSTGRTAYLELARQYLSAFEQGYHFGAIFCGQAYEMIRPHLPDSERKTFAEAWTRGAVAPLGRYVGPATPALARLPHVWNHAIGACVYADYARYLFPEEAAAYRMEATTDKVWKSWWNTGEFFEQASNYEGFAVSFLCFWADLRGMRREFYAASTVRNILERGMRIVSPAGLVAPYGDSGYNEHATAWIALFEKAGRETGDGRYVRTARDVFDAMMALKIDRMPEVLASALKQNPYNARVLFGQFLHMMSWLGMAARWADPALKPTPRAPATGLIRRLPRGYRVSQRDRKRLPDKRLVVGQVSMGGGPSGNPTYLLLSVGPALEHDHPDAGAIHFLSRGRTHLLGTCGYLQRELCYHNLFYVQKASRTPYPDDVPGRAKMGAGTCGGQLQELRSQGQGAYARVVFDNYHGFPIHLTREIVIEPSGSVILLDTVLAKASGYCGGLLFHGETIRRAGAGRWLLRLNMLRSMCGIEGANPPGELMIEPLYPKLRPVVRTLGLPSVYQAEGYCRFPCNHYKRIWASSYTGRKCLAFRAELKRGCPQLMAMRLTPV